MASERDKAILNMIMNPMMPTGNVTEDVPVEEEDYSHLENYSKAQELEVDGIRLSEEKKHDEALLKFDQAIEICPNNPSAYNNKAQTLQFQRKMDEALTLLNKAIELSKGKGKTAAQSFAQRALIHRCQGRPYAAKEDLEKSAALGNKFAKMELVTLNPYAAMCNQMLGDVMEKLKHGN
ncbi:unnamed protein product [Bursaphelenchus okinawaensis]|uniref:TPR_REGION domain-containing protein n=1 Tax=Bursaphelenchus okinawaensis TaxID=465554 RepID=A0A811KA04_9BILA|nr:unnamed protein product [Bursaphelenchus okinawaensis]CAG9095572.1 unnamed protein product [Bursaphelenchus okinawaensis]